MDEIFTVSETILLAAYNFARRLKTLNGLSPTNTSAESGLQGWIVSSSIRSTISRD